MTKTNVDTLAIYNEVLRPQIDGLQTESLRQAVLPLSCVRLFDSSLMKAVLTTTKPYYFKGSKANMESMQELLLMLKNTNLMIWQKGYTVDNNFQHLAKGYLRDHEPELYRKANVAALAVFRSWLDRPVDNRGLFVNEELYHMVALEQEDQVVDKLKSRVFEYKKWDRDPYSRRLQLNRLFEYLSEDNELKSMTTFVPAMLDEIQVARDS